jgi:hypothetical protein
MKRQASVIDRDPEVQKIAEALGITGSGLRAKLCTAAVERVSRQMDRYRIEPETRPQARGVLAASPMRILVLAPPS